MSGRLREVPHSPPLPHSQLAALSQQVSTISQILDLLTSSLASVTAAQQALPQPLTSLASALGFYAQLAAHRGYSQLNPADSAVVRNIAAAAGDAYAEWGVTSRFVPWYGGESAAELLGALRGRVAGIVDLLARHAALQGEYVETWNRKSDAMGTAKAMKRRGNREKASRAAAEAEAAGVDLSERKRMMTRFTKMLLTRE